MGRSLRKRHPLRPACALLPLRLYQSQDSIEHCATGGCGCQPGPPPSAAEHLEDLTSAATHLGECEIARQARHCRGLGVSGREDFNQHSTTAVVLLAGTPRPGGLHLVACCHCAAPPHSVPCPTTACPAHLLPGTPPRPAAAPARPAAPRMPGCLCNGRGGAASSSGQWAAARCGAFTPGMGTPMQPAHACPSSPRSWHGPCPCCNPAAAHAACCHPPTHLCGGSGTA